MSKYILNLRAVDPQNNLTLECDNAQEAMQYKRKAELQGYIVEVRKSKKENEK